MRSSILSQCRDLSTGVMFSFEGSSYCASKGVEIAADEVFVFVVSLGRVSCNNLI